MGNQDQLGLLRLHQRGHRVDPRPHNVGSAGGDVLLALGALLGACPQALLPFLLGLGAVLVHETEQLGGYYEYKIKYVCT